MTTGDGVTLFTKTVKDEVAVAPFAPVHTKVYPVVIVGATLSVPPLAVFDPVHPPDAAQLWEFVVDHERAELCPASIVWGRPIKFTVGLGTGLTPTITLFDVAP